MRKAIYNGEEHTIQNDALTPDQVLQSFANTIYPDLKNGTAYEDENGNIVLEAKASTKGARVAIYNGERHTIQNDALTPQQVLESFANTIYPDLKNGTAHEDEDGNIVMEAKASTKGARVAIYNGERHTIQNDALTPQQVLESFANTIYPDLKNGTAHEDENGNIVMEAKASTKGARVAIYNGERHTIQNDALTPQQVLESFANTIYPDLKNGTAHEDENGNIVMEAKASTKGARVAVYNGERHTIQNDALTPDQVLQSFANTIYPDLKNGTAYEDEDGNIVLEAKASTKGH